MIRPITIIDRYIARTVFAATAVVALVVAAVVLLILVINQLEDLGDGQYQALTMLAFVALELPRRLLIAAPGVILVGALAGLGSLATHSELIVIRGAGLSMRRLAVSVAVPGVVLAALMVVFSAFVAPVLHAHAISLKAQAVNSAGSNVGTLAGSVWLRQQNRVVRFGSVLPDGRLAAVRVYKLGDKGRIERVTAAESARLADGRLVLIEPRTTKFSLSQVTTRSLDRRAIDLSIDRRVLELAVAQPGQLTVVGLSRYIEFLADSGVDVGRYQVEFWQRVATPLTTWVLTLFALPFAFGALRRVGTGQRLFVGGLVGLAFILVNRIAMATAPVYDVWAPLAALLPTVLLGVATAIWIRRLD